mmetsp:Transcript_20722/g.33405  ORF Transcript_20722/g.33405 Transcript_20722/m.33405 type:complete len:119 (+) Transcript_20722:190-546(+)
MRIDVWDIVAECLILVRDEERTFRKFHGRRIYLNLFVEDRIDAPAPRLDVPQSAGRGEQRRAENSYLSSHTRTRTHTHASTHVRTYAHKPDVIVAGVGVSVIIKGEAISWKARRQIFA